MPKFEFASKVPGLVGVQSPVVKSAAICMEKAEGGKLVGPVEGPEGEREAAEAELVKFNAAEAKAKEEAKAAAAAKAASDAAKAAEPKAEEPAPAAPEPKPAKSK